MDAPLLRNSPYRLSLEIGGSSDRLPHFLGRFGDRFGMPHYAGLSTISQGMFAYQPLFDHLNKCYISSHIIYVKYKLFSFRHFEREALAHHLGQCILGQSCTDHALVKVGFLNRDDV
jgi:hypothetical protein